MGGSHLRRNLRAALVGAVAVAALTVPSIAGAKSYTLPGARVDARVAPDGSVLVTENITWSFFGPFEGAYRDIPLRKGESIDRIAVLENGKAFRTGGCVQLGCSDTAGTYGIENNGSRVRIVWHYRAQTENRTFTVSYRFRGLAVAYDDVVDVNLRVWGDQWPVALDRLEASTKLPRPTALGPAYRVWGAPRWVRGVTERTRVGTLLQATSIASKQFVELRTVFPRRLLTSTRGAKVVGSSRVDLQACKLEYSIVSPK